MTKPETLIITDACIFLDLQLVQCWDPFFGLSYDCVTSYFVWEELDEETQTDLTPYLDQQQLKLEDPPADFTENLYELNRWNRLSIPDRSVFRLADQWDGILLTSDGVLRKSAKEANLATHGLFWLFQEMVTQNCLPSQKAVQHLDIIFKKNAMYRDNTKLVRAKQRMQRKWAENE
ncbi:MAG: hypothetical protein ACQETE_02620 [Bacteroidota bacterium]